MSVAQGLDLQTSVDGYYEACDTCSKNLDSCIQDLELAKTSSPTNNWYQSDTGVIVITALAFVVGYGVGVNSRGL